MRETLMVDGEALVMTMAMILPKFPVPAGCQNGVSGSESRLLVVAAQRNSFWKNDEPPSRFLSQGVIYRRRGSPRECLGWSQPPRRGLGPPAPGRGVGPPRPPLRLSGSVDLLAK